jgi:uncharacterized caspase-like protein
LIERIFAEAERLGVRIEMARLPPWERGRYYDELRLIEISSSLSTKQVHETGWHELAHAFYRDTRGHDSAIEDRAKRRAALMAVDAERYAQLERVSDDIGFIAAELGLPTRMVRLWRQEWAPMLALRTA